MMAVTTTSWSLFENSSSDEIVLDHVKKLARHHAAGISLIHVAHGTWHEIRKV
jgi:hypothetical protein